MAITQRASTERHERQDEFFTEAKKSKNVKKKKVFVHFIHVQSYLRCESRHNMFYMTDLQNVTI